MGDGIAGLLLYVAPIVTRAGLEWRRSGGGGGEEEDEDEHDAATAVDVLLSLLPLLVVFPSTFFPIWVGDEEREHELRHAAYAVAFVVAAATTVRWDVLADELKKGEEGGDWAAHLVVYFAVGAATLWWFVACHVAENRFLRGAVFTHHGDVAVLPLTLVAIGTFVEDVPDRAFRFSRSVPFFVPVVVAWATLQFVAFNGFATSTVTTHSSPGFAFCALGGLAVASTHLVLLETRASPFLFLFFPFVSSSLLQLTPRPSRRPSLREGWEAKLCTTSCVCAAPFLLLLHSRLGVRGALPLASVTFHFPLAVAAVASYVVPRLCGDAWVFPSSLHATLLTCSVLSTTPGASGGGGTREGEAEGRGSLLPLDVAAVLSCFFLSFSVAQALFPPGRGEEEERRSETERRPNDERRAPLTLPLPRAEKK